MEEQLKDILRRLEILEGRAGILEGHRAAKAYAPAEGDGEEIENLALAIANKAKDCDEAGTIQEKVLDVRNPAAKVLLCYYISYKYFGNAWLKTGDIEYITSELGVKIAAGNASNYIKDLRASLESNGVRKRGIPTLYRLNRNGAKRFEQILND